jgi:threonine/homoserine/homoserine lactone efflux protein
MKIIQFLIFVLFILFYVAIVGALIIRFASRGVSEHYRRGHKRNSEVPLGGL